MNLSFDGRSDGFKQIILVSILAHAALISGISIFSAPRYAVTQAPNSMQIIILKEPATPKVRERVLVTEHSVVPERVVQRKYKREVKQIQKPLVSQKIEGAVTKATPDYVKNPAPVYPVYAREQGWEGVVTLQASVEKDGSVRKVFVLKSSGYRILDEAASDAVQRWKFLPARVGHLSFASKVIIPVRFELKPITEELS